MQFSVLRIQEFLGIHFPISAAWYVPVLWIEVCNSTSRFYSIIGQN